MKIGIVIPARDEEEAVGRVVERARRVLPALGEGRIVVADNDSTDGTAEAAARAGAEVIAARPRGYGQACRAAIEHLGVWPEVLLFLDGDGSSRPEEMSRLLEPIRGGEADLVIGVRPPQAPMTPPQRWGNRLATLLIRLRWRHRYADLGPFRAIRRPCFEALGMRDRTWGWTVEMQILALVRALRVREVPVAWDRRLAGVSKISGTLGGVTRAGARILWTIGRCALLKRGLSPQK